MIRVGALIVDVGLGVGAVLHVRHVGADERQLVEHGGRHRHQQPARWPNHPHGLGVAAIVKRRDAHAKTLIGDDVEQVGMVGDMFQERDSEVAVDWLCGPSALMPRLRQR
jgi:hypothetical protein